MCQIKSDVYIKLLTADLHKVLHKNHCILYNHKLAKTFHNHVHVPIFPDQLHNYREALLVLIKK